MPHKISTMSEHEFLVELRTRSNRLRVCRDHWKQYMILRGILLRYNRFAHDQPYLEPRADTVMFGKCRLFLHLVHTHTYTPEQQRYLRRTLSRRCKRPCNRFANERRGCCSFSPRGSSAPICEHTWSAFCMINCYDKLYDKFYEKGGKPKKK